MFIWGLQSGECNTVIHSRGPGPAGPAPPSEGRPAVCVRPSPDPGWHPRLRAVTPCCLEKQAARAQAQWRSYPGARAGSRRHAAEPLPWSGGHPRPSV